MKRSLISLTLCSTFISYLTQVAIAAPPKTPVQTVNCEILVVGGGLAGVATAYEGLLAGRTVCLTEITDWVGGQISAQGTSALDERATQRSLLFYPRGYLELRQRLKQHYGKLNPGECWVSESCFLPRDGHKILSEMLADAAKQGKGQLKWFPSTVIKELELTPPPSPPYQGGDERGSVSPPYQGGDERGSVSPPYQGGDERGSVSPPYQGGVGGVLGSGGGGQVIQSAIAIQHKPTKGAPPLNTEPLSQTIADWYRYENSPRFEKTILRFVSSKVTQKGNAPTWYVVDATETGELIALADVPYRLGIDARSYLDPSSSSATGDPYCTQGFTYTFAMEATKKPQIHTMPPFYPQYSKYYSYELQRLASFPLVFTYRRIWNSDTGKSSEFGGVKFTAPTPGDISMQNWTWGNDYRPGTATDNLVYTRNQLQNLGQLQPGGWMGGLRVLSLRKAEEIALGYFYWLVAGTTDSQLGDGVKQPQPNNRYLAGLDSPMGTAHGLSKYPYMREGRRLIGRPSWGHPQGFTISEIDISRRDYSDDYYQQTLSQQMYRNLMKALAGLEAPALISGTKSFKETTLRTRSTIYPDSVGIGHYAIDFHPCMVFSPPELPGNIERPGERRGAGTAYPFQIPLRAMIPQKVDNMLVAGKSIATSHIAAAAYRVHSFEWSAGAAAGITSAFALEKAIAPYQLVDQLPLPEPQLEALQRRLQQNGNPTAFPDTSIFNESWEDWS